MGQWFQRFVATGLHGEVSDATIQGYLRSASQLEDIWQQIDDNVDTLIAQGMAPWDAYAKMGYALAYVRASRTYVVFVQELVKAGASAGSANAGYLPKITYDQALALCEYIEPYLEEAIKASTNSRYLPTTYPLPLKLGPHIRYTNQHFPLPHLQGIIGAAQQMRDWAAGLLAKYELALRSAKTPVPQPVSSHLEEMQSELGLGDFHLRSGVDMVGQISKGQATDELSKKADDLLWEAMESFFKVSQLVAFPGSPTRPQRTTPVSASQQQQYPRSAAPGLNSATPTPPTPVMSELFNQVITGPGAAQKTSTPPTPDVSDMLNKLITSPGPAQDITKPPTPDVSNLLNQLISGPGPAQERATPPAPDASDMLNQMIISPGSAQEEPTPPTPDVSDLLNQVIANPEANQPSPEPSKGPAAQPRASHPNKPTPEDNLLDLLSEITGEPKDTR